MKMLGSAGAYPCHVHLNLCLLPISLCLTATLLSCIKLLNINSYNLYKETTNYSFCDTVEKLKLQLKNFKDSFNHT